MVYDAFSLSARQVIQVTDRLIATIDNMSNVPCLNIVYLAFLLCLREKDTELYDLVCKNKLTNDVKFNNNSNILANHIALMPFWKNMDITLYLQPSLITDVFYMKNRHGYTNTWNDGNYKCNLLKFITEIHHHLQINKEERNNDILRINQEYARSLGQSMMETDYSNGQFWVKPAFNKLNPPTFNISTYKDLVELASNLDHIDEE